MRAPAVFLLLCSAFAFADAQLDAVYQRMDRAAASFKGLTASLTKIDHSDLVDVNDKSEGTIAVRKSGPHNLQVLEKIETQDGKPDEEDTEFSGNRVVVYRPKDPKPSTEYDVGKKYRGLEEAAFGLFGGSSKDLQQNYKVAYGGPEQVNGQPTVRLVLSPTDPQMAQNFPKVEVWISDATGIAVQQKLYERGEKDYHLLTYSDMKLGPVADAQVKLNLPKNANKERPH
jgi:outer membrane lipoprotein-sorting protein